MDESKSWIPDEWRGLFIVLSQTRPSSVVSLEEWWKESSTSRYAQPLSWKTLCSALLCLEPIVVKNQLTFTPRLLLLPRQQQQTLLAFLSDHKDSLSTDSVKSLCDCLERVEDDWIRLFVRKMKGTKTDGWEEYSISERNKDRFAELLSSLKENNKNEQSSVWQRMQYTPLVDADDLPSSMPFSQPPAIDVDTPQMKHLTNSFCLTQNSPHTPRGMKRNLSLSQSSPQIPRGIKRKLGLEETQLELSQTMPQSQCSGADASFGGDMSICSQMVPSVEIERIGRKLMECWEEQEDVSTVAAEIEILTRVTIAQMSTLCKDLCTLSECGLLSACQHVAGLSTQLPHSHAVCWAQYALLPKLHALNTTCSRSLLQSFVTFAKMYGRAMIEGALLPGMQSHEFCASKADLLNKVIKEAFDTTLKEELLRQVSGQCVMLSEAALLVLQTLLDAKLTLEEENMSSFVRCLEKNSTAFSSNLKFGKLLLALANKYSKQLQPSHVSHLQAIVTLHTSFLKKSLQSALNKLSA